MPDVKRCKNNTKIDANTKEYQRRVHDLIKVDYKSYTKRNDTAIILSNPRPIVVLKLRLDFVLKLRLDFVLKLGQCLF